MSVTVVKKMFKGTDRFATFANLRLWVEAQIPELKLFKSNTTNSSNSWWLYRFGDTDYGVIFYRYPYGVHDNFGVSFCREITEDFTINHEYDFEYDSIMESEIKLNAKGAIVVRTPYGVIIQWMTYAGAPYSSFFYFGKANSAIKGEVTVHGVFSTASYVYSSSDSLSQNHASGNYFHFKIDNETPAVWRHGVLTAICPRGTAYGAAGSIVASAVYGVTSAAWIDPIRIDAFYALTGPVYPPYYTEVTTGGRKMQRVGKELLLEG